VHVAVQSDPDVVHDGQVREQPDVLERAPDPDPRNDGHFQWAAEIICEDLYWAEALN